jgi:amino acid adenylation domain-containing protein
VAQAHDATLFMALLAAFDVLLHRYTGQGDLVVGTPLAGRDLPPSDAMVGHFVRTLPMRARFDGDPTFGELLAAVRATTLAAFDHQDVPAEPLVQSSPRAAAAGEAGYQAIFVLQDGAGAALSLGAAAVEPLAVNLETAKFDVMLSAVRADDGLHCLLEYRDDLFDADTIDRMLGHFRVLVEGAVADPSRRVSRIPLLTEGERRRMLYEWNDTRRPYSQDVALTELFDSQVARTPDAPAVTCRGVTLSYRELDARVARLAAHLAECGVGPESVAALYVERSIDMVVAIIAIHRAGGAYLPLDPSYPRDRLEFMLRDAGATVVVTEESLRDLLPTGGAAMVSLDGDRAAVDAARPAFAPAPGGADRLAYLIYTSGSTGKPKGVGVTQRNVVNFLAGLGDAIPLGAGDALVAVTPLSFDISVLEVFHPLTCGARLVIAPRETVLDAAALAELLDASAATHMQATPATWRMLLDGGWPGRLGLVALCGGEALPPGLAAALLSRRVELWNMYGPTEATIWATMHRITTDDVAASAGATLPIGRPMANVRAYVLDAAGQPTPIGVPGELLLGGDGIARGYHERPELTAERFVRDPFSTDPSARLYRTGDRARWRADGVLQFLGRLDQQVKLRGHRIELGEIEHALGALPGAAASAAAVREDVPGDARLIAYVVTDDAPPAPAVADAATAAAWRSALAAALPEYMVPSTFVRLARLPLTPNGKVDRKALPAPPAAVESAAESHVAPRDDVERVLAGVWGEALGVRDVGVETSFFDLGGHSLIATRLVAQIAKIFRTRLSLRRFFDARTVSGIARALAAEEAKPGQAAQAARLYLRVQRMTPEERERLRAQSGRAQPSSTG